MSPLEPIALEPDLIRRLTRREYRALGATGLFDDERVELLYGQLVAVTPPDPAHEESVWTLAELLRTKLGPRAKVRPNLSFAASDESEPVPDVLVAPRQAYWDEHPQRAFLIVEVARTSLRKDRGIKARLYAEVATDEYWIVDLDGRRVFVLREPDGHGTWKSQRIAQRGETITLGAFPDVTIAVDDILPPIT